MTRIVLEPELGIDASGALHALLAPALQTKKTVTIEGGSVARLHGASLQVLCAFVSSRAAAGRKTSLVDPSPLLREGARALGLSSTLGLDP